MDIPDPPAHVCLWWKSGTYFFLLNHRFGSVAPHPRRMLVTFKARWEVQGGGPRRPDPLSRTLIVVRGQTTTTGQSRVNQSSAALAGWGRGLASGTAEHLNLMGGGVSLRSWPLSGPRFVYATRIMFCYHHDGLSTERDPPDPGSRRSLQQGVAGVRAQLWSHQDIEKDRRRRGEHSLSSSYLSPTSLSLALMLSLHTVRTPSPSCSLSPFASVASPVKRSRSWYSIVLSSLVMSPPIKPKAGNSIKKSSWRHSSPFSSSTSSSTALLWSLVELVPGRKGM